MDSTETPVDGRPDHSAFNGYFESTYHPSESVPIEPIPNTRRTWDTGSLGKNTIVKGTVVYRMWCGGYGSRCQQSRAAYPGAPDGIQWTKPNLG